MTELDRTIIRLALAEARRHLRAGCPPDEAVIQATPGAWQEYRLEVLYLLLNNLIDEDSLRLSGDAAVPTERKDPPLGNRDGD